MPVRRSMAHMADELALARLTKVLLEVLILLKYDRITLGRETSLKLGTQRQEC